MADFTVRYADFKGGEFGLRDPAKADSDTFSGVNVYPYESGLLGVRAGVKRLPVTGLPGHTAVPGPLGFYVNDAVLMLVLGRPYSFSMAGGAAAAWEPWPVTPANWVKFIQANGKVYSLNGGQLFRHDSAAAAPVLISVPTLLSTIIRWGYFFVAVDATVPWRIRYSEVSAAGPNFDSWPANNYLDVGNNEPITALAPIFNTLYVGKRSGWNAVSGVLGTLASVRGAAIGLGPIDPRTTTVTTDNRIIYWPVESSPAWFNGERVYIDSEQEVTPRNLPFPGDSVIVTPTGRRLILASDDGTKTNISSWSTNAWSRSSFLPRIGAIVPGDVTDGEHMPESVVYAALRPTTIGEEVVVVSYNHQLNRPGHLSDQYSAPNDYGSTDPVEGYVTFPSYWEPIGRQVRVRTLIVQFRKWASGVADGKNAMQVRVHALGKYSGGLQPGQLHDWIEPAARASTSGSDDSWRLNLGDQGFGNGFQIEFIKLSGVAIREIVALCDVRTERA